MKKLFKSNVLYALLAALFLNSGCYAFDQHSVSSPCSIEESRQNVSVSNLALEHETKFGGAYIKIKTEDFFAAGFAFGDSLDITFSNGKSVSDVPFYNGYYTQVGGLLVVGYPGYPYIKIAKNYGSDTYEELELNDDVTANISLNQAKKYLTIQETFSLSYSKNRSDYPSDVAFANYRAMKGGSMKENIFFRSASPCCNDYNRAPYVDKFMQKDSISFVLDLSDTAEDVQKFKAAGNFKIPYFDALVKYDRVAFLDMGANYKSDAFKRSLAIGLKELIRHKGPYLAHCIEGKDRTGFVGILLEDLCSATVEEMKNDYMITYKNYYGITKENDPERYNAILGLHFDSMYSYIKSLGGAKEYLKSAGMTDDEITKLLYRLID